MIEHCPICGKQLSANVAEITVNITNFRWSLFCTVESPRHHGRFLREQVNHFSIVSIGDVEQFNFYHDSFEIHYQVGFNTIIRNDLEETILPNQPSSIEELVAIYSNLEANTLFT